MSAHKLAALPWRNTAFATDFVTEDCFSLSCTILISFFKKLPLDLWIDRSFRKPSYTDAGWRRPHQQTKLAFGACVFPLIWLDNPNPWNLYVSDSQAETHVHIYPQFSSKVKQNHQTKDDHRKLKDSSPPEIRSSWWNVFFFSHGIMLDFRHQKNLSPKQLQLKFNPLWLVKILTGGQHSREVIFKSRILDALLQGSLLSPLGALQRPCFLNGLSLSSEIIWEPPQDLPFIV